MNNEHPLGRIGQPEEIGKAVLYFVSDDGMELRETDINRSMEETIRIVWNELKYKCQVHKDLADIPSIQSYAGQLKQAQVHQFDSSGRRQEHLLPIKLVDVTLLECLIQTCLVVRGFT